jgi:hypothetical protein
VELPTPQAKLRKLIDIIVALSTTAIIYPEVAIRAWALQDDAVRDVQMRVDQRRLSYVKGLCEEITGDVRKAQLMSQMLYAILVGSEQMQPPLNGDGLRAVFNEWLRLYRLKEDDDENK